MSSTSSHFPSYPATLHAPLLVNLDDKSSSCSQRNLWSSSPSLSHIITTIKLSQPLALHHLFTSKPTLGEPSYMKNLVCILTLAFTVTTPPHHIHRLSRQPPIYRTLYVSFDPLVIPTKVPLRLVLLLLFHFSSHKYVGRMTSLCSL